MPRPSRLSLELLDTFVAISSIDINQGVPLASGPPGGKVSGRHERQEQARVGEHSVDAVLPVIQGADSVLVEEELEVASAGEGVVLRLPRRRRCPAGRRRR